MGEIWGAALIAGGAVVGGIVSATGAESAANTQAGAAENAQQISQNEFNTITQQEQPFIQGGYGALSNLDYMLGIGPNTTSTPSGTPGMNYTVGAGGSIIPQLSATSGTAPTSTPGSYGSLTAPFTAQNFQQLSPAYQFQLQQGQQGVLNADAGSQGALSGATMKDLIGYNQNLANTSFSNAFNQYQTQQGNIFSRLSGIAQLGQAAATNTGQQGTALAGQAAQAAVAQGSYNAAGTVGVASAISGAINSATPWLAYGGGGNYGNGYTISGGFGYNPSGNAAAIDPATGTDYSAWSDRRLKTAIERIGELPSGLPFYRFRYTFALDEVRYGVMADEVREVFPEAVSTFLGYDRVDYRRIG